MTPPEPGTAPEPDTVRDPGAARDPGRVPLPDAGSPTAGAGRAPETAQIPGGARTVLRRSLREREGTTAPAHRAAPDHAAGPTTPEHPVTPEHPTTPDRPVGPTTPDHPTVEPPGATAPATPPSAVDLENDLRGRLGLRTLGARLDPTAALWGWLGPVLVTVLAGVMRLVNLNHPSRLIFDETYYVKQAYSMLVLGYEGEWAENANPGFARGDYSGLSTRADYVVHPSVGKWMIAAGIKLFGADNGAGWRLAAAVVGTLSVLILARMATRLFGSALLGTTAGLLLAVDGLHLTESRTSLLDIFLMFWVLVGLWCVLRDRDWSRARLARRLAAQRAAGPVGDDLGPRLGVRWWLVAAGVALGLACGVKWSGIYAVAVFGVMVFVWDTAARRAVGVRPWLGAGVLRGGVPAFVALVPVAALTYLATWFSWFTHPDSYRRQWAADLRASGAPVPRGWLPDALNSWWEYHLAMWQFHNNLESKHAYQSQPAGWLLQLRPTSMYWPDPAPPPEACGAKRCVEAVLAVGNPIIWWLAAAALLVLVYLAVRGRDWRAWLILAGYGAMYLPWLGYAHRTIFTFYAVAFVPYVVLCLTFVLGWAMGIVRLPREVPLPWRRRAAVAGGPAGPGPALDDGAPALPMAPAPSRLARFVSDDGAVQPTPRAWLLWGVVVGLAVVAAVFFWPIWTGQTVSYDAWRLRMWLPSWI
ncbi:dolichyl-phosphate-mannose--protein mannosyltransferase [Georgenia thermotolerans]|uniref:Polyprenol-phosphate-mannose--protein mannosyltransferase n=1 Tax=Georgenia thermotolerans TaxID=527326 RepID=A0A7J5UTM6_9MICO|nr:phospholipid carrier-dependent glycosyltransferase [Georgenia thermotolerans]KAE8765637.1 phospholipid carrier-dependent glycosyltransferase [Georgenia thermotolerans]